MVSCKICNKQFNFVSNTHLKTHGVTLANYISIHGNSQLRSVEYKQKLYRGRSASMKRLRLAGIIKPGPMSLERRKQNSERMKRDNPMKNPEIARKVGLSNRGKKSYNRTLENRLLQSQKKLGILNPRFTGGDSSGIIYHLWNGYRKQALERDNYKCVDCGMDNEEHKKRFKKGLDVHHEKPYKIFKEHDLRFLKTVCRPCHIRREQFLIRELKGTVIQTIKKEV